jgi:glutamate racemase
LPGVQLIDTAEAVARQTARLASELTAGIESDPLAREAALPPASIPTPPLRAWSSGSPEVLAAFAHRWLGLRVEVQDMRC